MVTPVCRLVASVASAATVCALAACSSPPVRWSDVTYPASRSITLPRQIAGTVPTGACPTSLRAVAAGADVYGVWWHVRADSSAVLMAGRSTDRGATWSTVAPADSTDRSRRGCNRPPPAIFADSATGYLDIAYFLEASEGAGVFYTHSMDAAHVGSGNGIFHSPVAIVYGERPARVAVAAVGDDVAVAYEDPNAMRPLVSVALSRSMGHIFDARTDVSSTDLPAADPRIALAGDSVTVEWSERPDSVAAGGRVAARRGEWR